MEEEEFAGKVRNKKTQQEEDFLAAKQSSTSADKPKPRTQRSSTKQAFTDVGFRAPAIERGDSGGRGRGRGRGGDREEGGGRGGRGGRGGGRGRGEHGDRRPPRNSYHNDRSTAQVDLSDESSFPKL